MNATTSRMKIGRYGSNAVKLPIHAPPIPSESNTRGPAQQAVAPMAAKVAPINEVFVLESIRPSFRQQESMVLM